MTAIHLQIIFRANCNDLLKQERVYREISLFRMFLSGFLEVNLCGLNCRTLHRELTGKFK